MDASNDAHRSSAVHRHRCVHHHHHHHHHDHHNCIHKKHHLNCAHHHHHHHICHHSAAGPPHAPQPPRTAHPLLTPNTEASLHFSNSDLVDEVLMQEEVDNEEREGLDDDDPVFVMTDEWKEFFAKSEARRRLAKQQAKMKGKKKN
ncbi:unnamed protein product [Rhodiola kirilowii]